MPFGFNPRTRRTPIYSGQDIVGYNVHRNVAERIVRPGSDISAAARATGRGTVRGARAAGRGARAGYQRAAGSYPVSIWRAPWGQMEERLGAFWGQKVGRSTNMFINRGFAGSIMAIGGAVAGAGVGGGPGMLLGGAMGAFLGTRTTGVQALGMGAMGGVLGASIGGVPGGILGAAAGGALGAVGPIHGAGALWRSGTAGKVALGTMGAAGVGVLGAAAFGGGFSADAVVGGKANLATGLALTAPVLGAAAMTLPGRGRSIGLASLGAGLGGMMGGPLGGLVGGAAGAVGGIGLGMRDAARNPALAIMAGRTGFGATGNILGSAMQYMAKKPGRAGGLLGAALGISGLVSGVVNAALSPEPVGSMAVGSREALYGMDPNNLDTQALTLALHYRHQ